MIGWIVGVYIFGLCIQLFITAVDLDLGGPQEGLIFRVLFWPIDWLRHFGRSFNAWRKL